VPVGIRFSLEGAFVTLPATCVDCVLVLIGLFGLIGTIILSLRNLSPYNFYYSPAPVFHKSTFVKHQMSFLALFGSFSTSLLI
jgi:hypothetical protein